ncbi:hypothetical protein P3X46_034524 [Hevea brasiliensis]|uniref:Uncharacterized protein n=1 Tax=Hevea brasiliensis TaxID=3981 RepID=A0ABQ9K9C7_HEVBR|nr:hypothetical protein P3X46_034524 [Hevea brasiliensis]
MSRTVMFPCRKNGVLLLVAVQFMKKVSSRKHPLRVPNGYGMLRFPQLYGQPGLARGIGGNAATAAAVANDNSNSQ